MITFCFYLNNYFLFSYFFHHSCHLNLFLCIFKLVKVITLIFPPVITFFSLLVFHLSVLFFACRLFCLIGVNLRAVVMTSEVNELLLTITHSLAQTHMHTFAQVHTCASTRTLTCTLEACIHSVHTCKHAQTNTLMQGQAHTLKHIRTHTHMHTLIHIFETASQNLQALTLSQETCHIWFMKLAYSFTLSVGPEVIGTFDGKKMPIRLRCDVFMNNVRWLFL